MKFETVNVRTMTTKRDFNLIVRTRLCASSCVPVIHVHSIVMKIAESPVFGKQKASIERGSATALQLNENRV